MYDEGEEEKIMMTYTDNFLRQGLDDETYDMSEKTYFPPWWKFWDRKVKTERSGEGDWIREFDREGNVVGLLRRRYALHNSGFGSRCYWEIMDMKTHIITAEPQLGHKVMILPGGICQKTLEQPDGYQEIERGFIGMDGTVKPHVRLTYRNGKQISCTWLKGNHTSKAWKEILKESPRSFEKKAEKMAAAVAAYREGKEIPTDEAELRAFKDGEEKEKLKALAPEARMILSRVRIRQRRTGR